MAISKIKPIRSTLRKAIDYIINPEKTDNGKLVASFGCSPQTADLEMEITSDKGSKNGNRIAYHMIQSFSPEDNISPEKALELGIEFAKKVTGGKHEFVVSTHIDGNCIHNHIIFNSVNFIDYTKYDNNKKDLRRMRNINDKICRENNLSVIEKYSGKRGKSKYEYEKSKLRDTIDSIIPQVSSFEEFVSFMELEGYEIKRSTYISYKIPAVGRFMGCSKIGPAYTEEAIRNRIENRDFEKSSEYQESKTEKSSQKSETKNKPKTLAKQKQKSRINMIVDISKNLKAQQSKGYEHALIRANINTLVQTMNYLISHDLQTPENFEKHYMDVNTEYKFLMKSNKKISSAMLDLSEKIKFTQNYKKNKWIYIQSLKARNKQEFYREHEQEIIQYKASLIYFERKEINPDLLKLSELFEEYRQLKNEKAQNDELLKGIKEKLYDLENIKKNLENSLNIKFDGINEKETKERDEKGDNRDEQEKRERD